MITTHSTKIMHTWPMVTTYSIDMKLYVGSAYR